MGLLGIFLHIMQNITLLMEITLLQPLTKLKDRMLRKYSILWAELQYHRNLKKKGVK